VKNSILIPLGILAAFALVGGCSVVSSYNGLNGQEKGVTATWRDSQVWYDNFWKKVRETAQVTEKYKDDFKEVFLGSIDGRYPPDRPVQFIMESNPTLDASLYKQIQRVIESGRDDFSQTQRTLVDRQRAYSTSLTSFPNVALAGMLGFPHEVNGDLRPARDADGDGKYTVLDYPIVTSGKTQEVFNTGREDEALDVFGAGK
jgi:hypothetical protein